VSTSVVKTRSQNNRPVQATALRASARRGCWEPTAQKPQNRLQRLSWMDPTVHRAPLKWAHPECEWKPREHLSLVFSATEHTPVASPRTHWQPGGCGTSQAQRRGATPLETPAGVAPRPPHRGNPKLPWLTRQVVSGKRSRAGPRGPPRRSDVDFVDLLMEGS
jgi:hypothetical protein